MVDKIKTKKSNWIPLVLIAVIAGSVVTNIKNKGIAEYIDDSGNIIVSKNNPFSQWFGKPAPDFTITDIEDKQHTLSSYLGKNVLVVFWATWCPPCKVEIPHLIELREQQSHEDLVILSISNESTDIVRNFVKAEGINYTAASLGDSFLPSPFIDVQYIPTTFFIDTNGKFKTVAVQSLTLEQIKAILEAPSVE